MFPNLTKIEYRVRPWPIYHALRWPLARLAVWQWRWSRSLPPPLPVKAALLRETARAHGLRTLVETGTFFGDLLAELESDFDRLISIELDPALCTRARQRFARTPKVSIVEGDSGEMLRAVIAGLDAPALIWLDGHFSGGVTARAESDTPILAELATLFAATIPHVILIDDARLFGVHPDYPSLDAVEARVRRHRPGWHLSVSTDVIFVLPPGSA